jgi:type II secretory pathway pseudopilin PulG
MQLTSERTAARRGFTVIEILIALLVIIVVAGLVIAAVMRLTSVPDEVQNRKDVDDLSLAVDEFVRRYDVYPPSRILLSNNPMMYQSAANGGDPSDLGPYSDTYLRKIWKKIDLNQPIDWSGGAMAQIGQPNYSVVLEGDQCLVYFVGGLPNVNPNGCRGFANSDRDPGNLTEANKLAPLFNFQSHRLYLRRAPGQPQHTYFSYKDVHGGQPFAYFSSRSAQFGDNYYKDDDCQSLGVAPYFSQANPIKKYLNPKSCQIISAGRDGYFGAVSGGNGEYQKGSPTMNAKGRDDISNFHGGVLSVPE